jgi:hypothetical protein
MVRAHRPTPTGPAAASDRRRRGAHGDDVVRLLRDIESACGPVPLGGDHRATAQVLERAIDALAERTRVNLAEAVSAAASGASALRSPRPAAPAELSDVSAVLDDVLAAAEPIGAQPLPISAEPDIELVGSFEDVSSLLSGAAEPAAPKEEHDTEHDTGHTLAQEEERDKERDKRDKGHTLAQEHDTVEHDTGHTLRLVASADGIGPSAGPSPAMARGQLPADGSAPGSGAPGGPGAAEPPAMRDGESIELVGVFADVSSVLDDAEGPAGLAPGVPGPVSPVSEAPVGAAPGDAEGARETSDQAAAPPSGSAATHVGAGGNANHPNDSSSPPAARRSAEPVADDVQQRNPPRAPATHATPSEALRDADGSLAEDVESLLAGNFDTVSEVLDDDFGRPMAVAVDADDAPADPTSEPPSVREGTYDDRAAEAADVEEAESALLPVRTGTIPRGANAGDDAPPAAAPRIAPEPARVTADREPGPVAAHKDASPADAPAGAVEPASDSDILEPSLHLALLAHAAPALLMLLSALALPLRFVPTGIRPLVDWLALSLVFWVPIVWVIAVFAIG